MRWRKFIRNGIMVSLLAVVLLLVGTSNQAAAHEGHEVEKEGGVKLRNWHFGLQSVNTWRDNYDVFGLPDMPPGEVEDEGRGAGVILGRRLGDRFLLGMQLAWGQHNIVDREDLIVDVEFLITGTVLFRERSTFQPFLRGGFGGGGEYLELGPDAGHIFSFGTSAIAGGGLQVRLSSRFSLDFEAVSTFTNFLEVTDQSEGNLWPNDSWQVRQSSWGTRLGMGIMFWF